MGILEILDIKSKGRVSGRVKGCGKRWEKDGKWNKIKLNKG